MIFLLAARAVNHANPVLKSGEKKPHLKIWRRETPSYNLERRNAFQKKEKKRKSGRVLCVASRRPSHPCRVAVDLFLLIFSYLCLLLLTCTYFCWLFLLLFTFEYFCLLLLIFTFFFLTFAYFWLILLTFDYFAYCCLIFLICACFCLLLHTFDYFCWLLIDLFTFSHLCLLLLTFDHNTHQICWMTPEADQLVLWSENKVHITISFDQCFVGRSNLDIGSVTRFQIDFQTHCWLMNAKFASFDNQHIGTRERSVYKIQRICKNLLNLQKSKLSNIDVGVVGCSNWSIKYVFICKIDPRPFCSHVSKEFVIFKNYVGNLFLHLLFDVCICLYSACPAQCNSAFGVFVFRRGVGGIPRRDSTTFTILFLFLTYGFRNMVHLAGAPLLHASQAC